MDQRVKKLKNQRMVMISFDAVGQRDLEKLKAMPNFSKIREKAAVCDHVQSVYPSITYPAHTSIVTGLKPAGHGIINNIKLQPQREKEDWFWFRKAIKAETIYDQAKKAGWKTAALLWPVTARSSIDYCVPEIFANRKWQNQVMVSATSGPIRYQIDLLKRYGSIMDGINQPNLDDFVVHSAVHTIHQYNPDLLMVHFTDVDTHRHNFGLDGVEIDLAMRRLDDRLGMLYEALCQTGDMDKTTIVVLGDHCQMDTHTIVYPNYYLKQAGLFAREDNPLKYDFVAQHCDGSCYIYASKRMKKQLADANKEQKEMLLKPLKETLLKMPKEAVYKIYLRKEAGALGADPNCICMLEAKPGYYFQNEWNQPFEKVEDCQGHAMKATHGYLPDQPEYETFFMMTGYGVKENAEVDKMYLWDEGPTIAKIMNIKLNENNRDGKVKEQLLE